MTRTHVGRLWLLALTGMVSLLHGTIDVQAATEQQAQLTALDGAESDEFGYAVAIDGETVVVGAPFDSIGDNTYQGSAYVFVREGATWSQQAKLTASNGADFEFFGRSVALDSDTVVIGAYESQVGDNIDQGSAYVFTRTGTTWSQQAQLVAADGAAFDWFGRSVDIEGDTAVVSAWYDDIGDNVEQGSTYVFTRSETTWSEEAKLTASDGAAFDFFGAQLALDDQSVVVGAYGHQVGDNADQGSAYVFTKTDGTWAQEAELTASDGEPGDSLGTSVALDGDIALLGASTDDVDGTIHQGSAYVFSRTGSAWSESARLTASDGDVEDNFGASVAMAGDIALVGAFRDEVESNLDQGSAYMFSSTGATWSEQAKLTAADGAAGDWFGVSVALDGDSALVGALGDDVGANVAQGSAYVFTGLDPSTPLPTLAISDSSTVEGEGDGELAVTITLSVPSTEAVTVGVSTRDRSAIAPFDYATLSAVATFLPGETVATVGVAIAGDTDAEADETFGLVLSDPIGATVTDKYAIATIVNDDETPPSG